MNAARTPRHPAAWTETCARAHRPDQGLAISPVTSTVPAFVTLLVNL